MTCGSRLLAIADAIRSLLDQSLQLRDQAGSLNRQLTQFKD
ncbi:hypothetical protein [Pseudomonas laurylsulfativorans]|nr:hypothetical protein [Pseudomonas laurylsulfativorans]